MTDFLVRRDDLRAGRAADGEERAAEAAPGAVQFRVERFGLTANNLTYGVFGDALGYWRFYPAADGWGRIPVWGFGEAAASGVEGVRPGTAVIHLVLQGGEERLDCGVIPAHRSARHWSGCGYRWLLHICGESCQPTTIRVARLITVAETASYRVMAARVRAQQLESLDWPCALALVKYKG